MRGGKGGTIPPAVVRLTAAERKELASLSPNGGFYIELAETVERILSSRFAAAEARAERAREYVKMVAKIHEAYRHLVMDTDEDRATHARLVEVADKSLALARAALAARDGAE